MALSRPALPEKIPAAVVLRNGVDTAFIVPPEGFSNKYSDTMYICSVCLCLPRCPISINGCPHAFCEHCIRTVLVTAQGFPIGYAGCPVCRTRFGAHNMLIFDRWPGLGKATFEQIKVRCPAATSGNLELRCEEGWFDPVQCSFEGSITELKIHERTECGNRVIECPNATCKKRGNAAYIERHFGKCRMLKKFCDVCGLAKYESTGLHSCIEALQWQLKRTSGNNTR